MGGWGTGEGLVKPRKRVWVGGTSLLPIPYPLPPSTHPHFQPILLVSIPGCSTILFCLGVRVPIALDNKSPFSPFLSLPYISGGRWGQCRLIVALKDITCHKRAAVYFQRLGTKAPNLFALFFIRGFVFHQGILTYEVRWGGLSPERGGEGRQEEGPTSPS